MNSFLRRLIFRIIFCRLFTLTFDRCLVHESLGFYGERLAARHLLKQGYYLTAQRFLDRLGEIDLIAVDQDTIVFVEVKTRGRLKNATPAEAVDMKKQARIVRTAKRYLIQNHVTECQTRFDIIAVICSRPGNIAEISHHKHAFEPHASYEIF